jgi:hypothetical protein
MHGVEYGVEEWGWWAVLASEEDEHAENILSLFFSTERNG